MMQSTPGDDVNYVVRGGGGPCRSGLEHVVGFSVLTYSLRQPSFWVYGYGRACGGLLEGGGAVALISDNVWAKMHIRVGVLLTYS